LPFQPATFDAAFCLQGLQYFADKPAALLALHRVMRENATLSIATWAEMRECAGHWAMISALEQRHIDAKDMRKPFALSDPNELRTLGESAGFDSVNVRTMRRTASFPSVQAFVESIAQGAPSSRLALARVPAAEWPDFLADVESRLARWSPGGRLEFPMASNVLSARRS
jgi:SAM-dependent methyltransferase